MAASQLHWLLECLDFFNQFTSLGDIYVFKLSLRLVIVRSFRSWKHHLRHFFESLFRGSLPALVVRCIMTLEVYVLLDDLLRRRSPVHALYGRDAVEI